jgi:hypothetical protein
MGWQLAMGAHNTEGDGISARHRFHTADAEEPIRTDGSTVLLARGLFAPFAVRIRGSLFPHVLRMIVHTDVAELNRHSQYLSLVRSD